MSWRGQSAGKIHLHNRTPIRVGSYIAGFVDGEGSFHVTFRPRKDYPTGWKVSLCLNVAQKDCTVLNLIAETLKCGTLRQRSQDSVWYFEVNNLEEIRQKVIPYFEKFGFISKKKSADFQMFKQIATLLHLKKERTARGIREILLLRNNMNYGGKSKYSNSVIWRRCLRKCKSSETIRQAYIPRRKKI